MLDRSSPSSKGSPVTTPFNLVVLPAHELQEAETALDHFLETPLIDQPMDQLDAMLAKAKGLEKKVKLAKLAVQSEILPRYLQKVEQRIRVLSDPEAPTIGKDLLAAIEKINCNIRVNPDLAGPAEYLSYHYSKGFVNEVGVNPAKVEDVHSLERGLVHEWPHGLQKAAAPALHYSPLNKDRIAIIHPDDWIMLELLCENDSYTMQGWTNSMLCENDPVVCEKSRYDLVSVNDFNAIRARCSSLQETLTETALRALAKDQKNPPIGITFVHHYQEVALHNYQRGIGYRHEDGQKPIFIRLEPEDFRAVGNYGVGPNVFGDGPIDPRFLIREPFLPHIQSEYDSLCKLYNIPPLGECITLREYEALNKPEKKATASPAAASYSSDAVHAPAV